VERILRSLYLHHHTNDISTQQHIMPSIDYDSLPGRHSAACDSADPDRRIRTMQWLTVHIPNPQGASQNARSLNNVSQNGEARSEPEGHDSPVNKHQEHYCWSSQCTRRKEPVGEDGYRSSNVFVGTTMEQPRLHSVCYNKVFGRPALGTEKEHSPPSSLDRAGTLNTFSSGSGPDTSVETQ